MLEYCEDNSKMVEMTWLARTVEIEMATEFKRAKTEPTERVRSTSKTPKSASTRKRIMKTASDLMAERGNTAFRMSEVSRRCGMSKGALYYYFADKEDLLQEIFDEEISVLVEDIDAAVANANSAEGALRGACRAYAACVRKGGPIAMAIVRELVLSHEIDAKNVDQSLMHIIGVVARLMDRAKGEGIVRPDVDTNLAAVAICGAYAFSAMLASDNPNDNKDADFAEELFDSIVQGVGKWSYATSLAS